MPWPGVPASQKLILETRSSFTNFTMIYANGPGLSARHCSWCQEPREQKDLASRCQVGEPGLPTEDVVVQAGAAGARLAGHACVHGALGPQRRVSGVVEGAGWKKAGRGVSRSGTSVADACTREQARRAGRCRGVRGRGWAGFGAAAVVPGARLSAALCPGRSLDAWLAARRAACPPAPAGERFPAHVVTTHTPGPYLPAAACSLLLKHCGLNQVPDSRDWL